jgi:hypothetical protein
MSHNVVTEIKQELTHCKPDTQIVFQRDMSCTVPIHQCILPGTHETSPYLCPSQTPIWELVREAISICRSLRFYQAALSESVTNHTACQQDETQCVGVNVISRNIALCDHFLVGMSYWVIGIVQE